MHVWCGWQWHELAASVSFRFPCIALHPQKTESIHRLPSLLYLFIHPSFWPHHFPSTISSLFCPNFFPIIPPLLHFFFYFFILFYLFIPLLTLMLATRLVNYLSNLLIRVLINPANIFNTIKYINFIWLFKIYFLMSNNFIKRISEKT